MSFIEIDLDDGLPPAKVETGAKKPAANSPTPARLLPEVTITITSTPVSVVILMGKARCHGCGRLFKEHRGIFLESKLSNGVRHLEHKTIREIAPFVELPRRIDWSPEEQLPVCCGCWHEPNRLSDMAILQAAIHDRFFIDPRKLPALIPGEEVR